MQLGTSKGMSEEDIISKLGDDYQDVATTIQQATEKINQFVLEEDGFIKLANHFEAQLQ
jgi:capsid protein